MPQHTDGINKDSMAAKPYSKILKNTKAEVEASGVSWLGQELAEALKHLLKEKHSLLKCSLFQPWRHSRASWLAAAGSAHISFV